jgi:phosphoserine phosphatase
MPLARVQPAVTLAADPGDILVLLSDGFYEYRNKAGELFGEARVRELVAAHRDMRMRELLEILQREVDAFGAGAPQDDDMTAVLVKREARP